LAPRLFHDIVEPEDLRQINKISQPHPFAGAAPIADKQAAIYCHVMTQRHPFKSDHIMMLTTNVLDRQKIFADESNAREAIECLYRVQELHPFFLYAFVIMPDHCHFLIETRAPITSGQLMNSYKAGLTFDLGIPKLWQRRYHIRLIDQPEFAKQYIHENPVRAGIVEYALDYPWSSASGKWEITPLPWE
jgi:REP element-mobilizing transposase RayT